MRCFFVVSVVAALTVLQCPAQAETQTIPSVARAEARSSTWIAVEAPFLGDDNQNGYTIIQYRRRGQETFASAGPFHAVGPPAWRRKAITGLTASTAYFIRVEFVDPDGIIDNTIATGPASRVQIIGPITTPASSSSVVSVEQAVAENGSNEILVAVPIRNDSNVNSTATFEVADDDENREEHYLNWSTKCGPSGPVHPKICRIRGLKPGQKYAIRIRVSDPDVNDDVPGSVQQLLRGIRYNGGENVALGKTVTPSRPGAPCVFLRDRNGGLPCADPADLTDGVIQYPDYARGFAWARQSCGNGTCPQFGNPAAVVDLGQTMRINRVVLWFHEGANIPTSWSIETSTNGTTYQQPPAYSATEPRCRTSQFALMTDWTFPACEHTASFTPVQARYVRYRFNDATLFPERINWLVELEVFRSGSLGASATRLDFNNQSVGTPSLVKELTFRNTGLAPVTLRTPQITPAGPFTLASNNCPSVLSVTAQCKVGVRFLPSTVGASTATLSLNHDGSISPINVQLYGTAVTQAIPVLTVPTALPPFPNVAVGAQTGSQRINLTNLGTINTQIASVTPPVGFRVTTNNCGSTVRAGTSCTIFVSFAPNAARFFDDTLTIASNAGSFGVRLTGSSMADSDGDGIPDQWELGPVTILNETINLAAMGASINRKDIFVELDYLEDAGHSHRPKLEAIRKVVDAYWARGISLHVDCGADCVMNRATLSTWGNLSRSTAVPHIDPLTGSIDELGSVVEGNKYSWKSFDDIKSRHLGRAREVIFRYGIFAHSLAGIPGTTGLARTQQVIDRRTASDLIVSLGTTVNVVGNISEQAGTFMHELGHNLGLTHGGCRGTPSVVCEEGAYKPNHISVMNYIFQMRGLFVNQLDGVMNYALTPLGNLDESKLNEETGLGATSNPFGTRYWCPSGAEQPVPRANGEIDWNCNGTIQRGTLVSANVDAQGGVQTLRGTSDWQYLVFTGGSIGQAGAPPPGPPTTPIEEVSDELTTEEDSRITTVYGVSIAAGSSLSLPPGASGSITFTVRNRRTPTPLSPGPDEFAIQVTPTSGIASWVNTSSVPTSITLLAGAERVITIPVTASPSGGFGEVALRSTSVVNPNAFDVGRVAITSGLADLTISVEDVPDPLHLGNRLAYTAVVHNPGTDGARNVQVTADLPELGSVITTGAICFGVTRVICNLGDLGPGQRAAFTIAGTPRETGILRGVFRAAAATPDPNTANNVSNTSTAVSGRPVLMGTVTDQSRSGQELSLRIMFRNTSAQQALNAKITGIDTRVLSGSGSVSVTSPTGPVSLGDLAPGQSVVISIVLSVPTTATRLNVIESGTVEDSNGNVFYFSVGQAVTP